MQIDLVPIKRFDSNVLINLLDATDEWCDLAKWEHDKEVVTFFRYHKTQGEWTPIEKLSNRNYKRMHWSEKAVIAVRMVNETDIERKIVLDWIATTGNGIEAFEIPIPFSLDEELLDHLSIQQLSDDWIVIFHPYGKLNQEKKETGLVCLYNGKNHEWLVCDDPEWADFGIEIAGVWKDVDEKSYAFVITSRNSVVYRPSDAKAKLIVIEMESLIDSIRLKQPPTILRLIDTCSENEEFCNYQSKENRIHYSKYRYSGDNESPPAFKGTFSFSFPDFEIKAEQEGFEFFNSVMHGLIAFDEHDAVYRNAELYEIAQLSVITIHHYSKGEDCFSGPFIGEPVYLNHRNRLVIMEESPNKWF